MGKRECGMYLRCRVLFSDFLWLSYKWSLLLLFTCAVASLYEVVSVGPSVGPSVRPSVPCYFQTRTRRILCRVFGLVVNLRSQMIVFI